MRALFRPVTIRVMRISLEAKAPLPMSLSRTNNVSLSVTIKPANNVVGSFEFQTDSEALMQLLKKKTDLSGYVLDAFRSDLEISTLGRIRALNLKDEVLEEIGYFID